MNLDSILKKYLVKGNTGQLILKYSGEKHLCKISVDNGKALYISIGKKSPDETLDYIESKEIDGADFLEGASLLKRLDEPINDRLFDLIKTNGKPDAKIHVHVEAEVPAQKVETALYEFIDIVGPLGTIISDKVISSIGYKKGTPMNGNDYSILLSALIDEISEDRKEEFKNRNM